MYIFLQAGFLKEKIFNVAFFNETNPCQHNYSEIIKDIEIFSNLYVNLISNNYDNFFWNFDKLFNFHNFYLNFEKFSTYFYNFCQKFTLSTKFYNFSKILLLSFKYLNFLSIITIFDNLSFQFKCFSKQFSKLKNFLRI